MCRWIVYRGRTIWLCDIITRPDHGLVKQCYERFLPYIQKNIQHSKIPKSGAQKTEVNSRINADGFGIGWYSHSVYGYEKPCTFHSVSPAPNNRNLKVICDHVQTNLLFAHVRASSGTVVAENNCHPFVSGRWMFMHNGAIGRFLRVKRVLGQKLSKEVYYSIDGTTDSEHAFALLLDILGNDRDKPDLPLETITQAFIRTIQVIIKLVQSVEESDETHMYSSLNFALTNGKIVIASRFRDGPEDPPSLYYHDKGIYQCDLQGAVQVPKVTDDSTPDVIIASEPLTEEEVEQWHLVQKDHVVICDEENRLQILPIPYEPVEKDSYWWK